MCGRYASSRDPEALVEEFEVERVDGPRLPADFNVAPTKQTYAVLTRVDRDTGDQVRRLRPLRWGLVPSWAKDVAIGNRLVNARMESVAVKPAFRKALALRRCLIPADGYYEWYGTTKGRKQPYYIHSRDGSSLALAGLYEIWRDPEKDRDDPDAFLWTCTILTTTAEDDVGRIHDRMPLVVERERFAAWLDPTNGPGDDLGALLVPAAPGRLEAYPVSKDVNNVRNNGPHLVEPLPPEAVPEAAAPDAEP
jgi:putative SOS response-associated peptidase YedK